MVVDQLNESGETRTPAGKYPDTGEVKPPIGTAQLETCSFFIALRTDTPRASPAAKDCGPSHALSMSARLADGLGLKGALDAGYPASYAPSDMSKHIGNGFPRVRPLEKAGLRRAVRYLKDCPWCQTGECGDPPLNPGFLPRFHSPDDAICTPCQVPLHIRHCSVASPTRVMSSCCTRSSTATTC